MWDAKAAQATLEKMNRDARNLLGLAAAEPDRSVPTPEELRVLAGYGPAPSPIPDSPSPA